MKYLISPRAWYITKLTLFFLSILIPTYYIFTHNTKLSQTSYKEIYKVATKGKKGVFVEDFLATEIDGPYNNRSLISLCQSTKWQPGLIFSCDVPAGGIVNIRNVILNCIRYMILAGATSFILPSIPLIPTSSTDTPTPVPISHYFDLEFFTTTLTSACPKLTIHDSKNDFFNFPSTATPVPISPSSLISESSPLIHNAILPEQELENWRQALTLAINDSLPNLVWNNDRPVLVNLLSPLLEFPLSYDTPAFVASFGRILRFRQDVRKLAATTLFALERKYALGINLKESGIPKDKFLGVNLRSERGVSMDVQIQDILSSVKKEGLRVIFVSCLEEGVEEGFREGLSIHHLPSISDTTTNTNSNSNYTTTTTSSSSPGTQLIIESTSTLLRGSNSDLAADRTNTFNHEWNQYTALTWDQRLLVDYEVLLRSSVFVGGWESAFSWNLAGRRSLVAGEGRGIWVDEIDEEDMYLEEEEVDVEMEEVESEERSYEVERKGNGRRWQNPNKGKSESSKIGKVESTITWKDEFSALFGPVWKGERVRASLWP